MASSVNIHEAKTQFSKLVRRAEQGEEIVVRRGSEPVARIAPLKAGRGGVSGFGSMREEVKLPSATAWKQGDKEIEQAFEGSEIFPAGKLQPEPR